MKDFLRISVVLILLCSNSCKKENSHDFGLDCDKLRLGIYLANRDSDAIDSLLKVEMDKVTKDLTPKPTVADLNGQLANLYTLFTRLQTCQDISYYITCYSCIQTAPPQTEVMVLIDSAGYQVRRTFDFYTWERDNLAFAGAHNYYPRY
jgi:hypothetical protein